MGRPAAEQRLPTTEPAPLASRRAGSETARARVKSTLRCESQLSAPTESAQPLQHPCQLGLAKQPPLLWNKNRANQATRVAQEAKDGCRRETAEYTGFPQFNLSWDISALRSILDAPQHALLAKCVWGVRGEYPSVSNHPEMGPNTMHVDMPGVLFYSPPQGERDGVLRSMIYGCPPWDGGPQSAHGLSWQEFARILNMALTQAKSQEEFPAVLGGGRWVQPLLYAGEAGMRSRRFESRSRTPAASKSCHQGLGLTGGLQLFPPCPTP